jgi:hypothetical protein
MRTRFASSFTRWHTTSGTSFARSQLREAIAEWSLTSLREKLIKIGAKVVSHGRYVTFQIAEVAISRKLFAAIMQRIAALRAPPMATAT